MNRLLRVLLQIDNVIRIVGIHGQSMRRHATSNHLNMFLLLDFVMASINLYIHLSSIPVQLQLISTKICWLHRCQFESRRDCKPVKANVPPSTAHNRVRKCRKLRRSSLIVTVIGERSYKKKTAVRRKRDFICYKISFKRFLLCYFKLSLYHLRCRPGHDLSVGRIGTKYSVTENWFVGNTSSERFLYSVGTICNTLIYFFKKEETIQGLLVHI